MKLDHLLVNLTNFQETLDICGTTPAVRKLKNRAKIINGRNTEYGSWPWIVNIKHLNSPYYVPVDEEFFPQLYESKCNFYV